MSRDEGSKLISICIPAYKQTAYVRRLLDSIVAQTFSDFDIVISDDSPDNSVQELVTQYSDRLPITYLKNNPSAGTPANWNCGIRQAKGEWIKLMHDDDWFANPSSLQEFANAIHANPAATFIFSAFTNIRTSSRSETLKPETQKPKTLQTETPQTATQKPETIKPEPFRLNQLQKNPVSLLSKNIIGPPSVVIHKNDQYHFYDEKLKWLVDMDFYMRYLNNTKAVYIDKPLVNIGINELQVTNSSSLVPEVEIPEHFRVLEKTGIHQLKNILVFDAWWRLFRNLAIRNTNQIKESGYHGKVPGALLSIIKWQKKVPKKTLRIGPISKTLMSLCYSYCKITGLLSEPHTQHGQ